MVKLVAQQTADSLSIKEWGGSHLEVLLNSEGNKYIMVHSPKIGINTPVDEVLFYDNNNMLLHINGRNGASDKYKLLTPNMFSKTYSEISCEVFDGMYRKVVDFDNEGKRLLSLLNETTGVTEFPLVKWKDILDVHNDIAIVSFKDNVHVWQSLVRFKHNLYGNELVAQEIIHIQESLYKYRQNSNSYRLYNADNRLSSETKTAYTDIKFISDQLAMGVIDDVQWDFIRTCPADGISTLQVVHSSFEEPIFDDDIISIVNYDKNDIERRYKINFSGTRLSEGNELDLNLENEEIRPSRSNESETSNDAVDLDFPILTIGRFIVVNDNLIKVSENMGIIISQKSLRRPCDIDSGAICWILIKDKSIVITKRNGISDFRRTILYMGKLTDDFDDYSFLANNKWYIEDCFICKEEHEIVETSLKEIRSKLNEKVKSAKIDQYANAKLATNDTKDILKLKAIYNFLKEQAFDKDAIYNVLYILFPSIEQFIDLTNVKIDNAELCKRIEEHSQTRDLISSDTSNLIKMLELNDKELAILNYYTKVKGLSISTAIEYINEESPTGARVIEKFSELMRLGDILANERKELRELIIEGLIRGYVDLADTSEILKPLTPPITVTKNSSKGDSMIEGQDFVVDRTKKIDAVIKEKILKFEMNGVINYELFENKKVYNFNHEIHYVQVGKDILVFINKGKAEELDKEHPHNINLRGNGEDKRFSQDFTHINGIIRNQRENNSRIFVFEHIDDKTCRFYDELQYLDYDLEREDGREVIMFKMKSLHRFS